MNIALILFDDAEELDFVGPWEVFTMVKPAMAMVAPGETPPHVFTVSEKGGTVTCAKGMRVIADHNFADAPKADVILVPGGQGTRREVSNEAMLGFIRDAAASAIWVTSVCTGSYLLAAAGPAKGKVVTTHWGFVEQLRKSGLAGEVRDDMRFVRDGNVVTSAGVSAGIDMALWLTGQIWSPAIARATQRAMEYDPAPPYQAMV
jgi:transcriptional regulator GlxA family with amidase domain